MAKVSPTQRSLKLLRSDGWNCHVTEKWNAFARIRQDAFGFGDILAFRNDETTLVQTTSLPNVSARIKKILDIPEAHSWANGGGRSIIVHGWAKKGSRWICKVVHVLNEKSDAPLPPIE